MVDTTNSGNVTAALDSCINVPFKDDLIHTWKKFVGGNQTGDCGKSLGELAQNCKKPIENAFSGNNGNVTAYCNKVAEIKVCGSIIEEVSSNCEGGLLSTRAYVGILIGVMMLLITCTGAALYYKLCFRPRQGN